MFFFLFFDSYNNFFIIAVVKEKNKIKTELINPVCIFCFNMRKNTYTTKYCPKKKQTNKKKRSKSCLHNQNQ